MIEIITLTMKTCSKCNIQKIFEEFNRKRSSKDGLNSYCKSCSKNYCNIWRKANPDRVKVKAINAAWRKANPEKVKINNAIWHKTNFEKIKARTNAKSVAWRKANPGKVNANAAKRRAGKLQRTPKWLTKEQLSKIKQFYRDAAELSWLSDGGLEVDHIVPLQGKLVSGLHVPWNLQILSSYLNNSKGNKFNG